MEDTITRFVRMIVYVLFGPTVALLVTGYSYYYMYKITHCGFCFLKIIACC